MKVLFDRNQSQRVYFAFERLTPERVWTGNVVAINNSIIEEIESKTIDVTSVNHLYLPNLIKLDLHDSNLKQVATICGAQFPNLKVLDLSGCKGMVNSEIEFSDSFAKLGDIDIRFPPFKKLNASSARHAF